MTEEQSTSSASAAPKKRISQGKRKAVFLAAVRRSGSIHAGCRAAALSRRRVLRWLAYDTWFRRRFYDAVAEYDDRIYERLEQMAWKGDDRAFQQLVRLRVIERRSRLSELETYLNGCFQQFWTDDKRRREQDRERQVQDEENRQREKRLASRRRTEERRAAAAANHPGSSP